MGSIKNTPRSQSLFTTDAGDNAAKQLSDIEDLITKGVDLVQLSDHAPWTQVFLESRKLCKRVFLLIISNRSTNSDQFISQQSTSNTNGTQPRPMAGRSD